MVTHERALYQEQFGYFVMEFDSVDDNMMQNYEYFETEQEANEAFKKVVQREQEVLFKEWCGE